MSWEQKEEGRHTSERRQENGIFVGLRLEIKETFKYLRDKHENRGDGGREPKLEERKRKQKKGTVNAERRENDLRGTKAESLSAIRRLVLPLLFISIPGKK